MKLESDGLRLSATDLVGYLNCRHLTQLEQAVAKGTLERPHIWDPLLEVLWARGTQHEEDYVQHLKSQGLDAFKIDGVEITTSAVADTLAAMQAGRAVIVQGALASGQWVGRADILRRVEQPSALGSWSYEVIDTKLARETKGGTVLQLSLYSDMLATAQGSVPEQMYVVQPWTEFAPQVFRTTDFAAFYRQVKASLEATLQSTEAKPTYPDPVEHCDICKWRPACSSRRREDDHLSLVAGVSKLQTGELIAHGIGTLASLAEMPLPLSWKPERGSVQSLVRLREQARVQLQTRETGVLCHELLSHEPGFGLSCLPAPSAGDIFLDFEGDSFIGEKGLEYLLGFHFLGDDGAPAYRGLWALTRAEEKAAFESFIDFVMARWEQHPTLHIYHFGGYERGALTRLMGRYATREDELDRMLRGRLLVDLLTVVRQGIRAGVESYSIKKLEPLYGFERDTSLPDANLALTRLEVSLELNDPEGIADDDRATVESYNRDDCVSTEKLRDWLEGQRVELIAQGNDVQRPEPGDPAPGESVAEWLAIIAPLVEALTADVPVDATERTAEQHGRWLLAQMLDWHRREDKAVWWELFRLSDLPVEDLRDERAGLADLQFAETVGGTAKCPIHRYGFPHQEADVRPGKALYAVGGSKLGTVEAVSLEEMTIDIKKREDAAALHPEAIFVHEYVRPDPIPGSLVRLAEFVVEHGLEGDGPYMAARDLLLRRRPRVQGDGALILPGETPLDAGKRLALALAGGALAIQGPPGTGKTFTGAHMICELVRQNKKVGIVANGHEVIRNLLNAVIKVADEAGTDLQCVQKPKAKEPNSHRLRIVTKAADLFGALQAGCQVAGGTAWLWAAPEAHQTVDVLFVDEAAQMSLANVLAVSQAAQTVILLGDPQQLDQPTQGSHPDGTDCSALHHLLEGRQTISTDEGLFLDETWRLHPDICAFTSELFYEGKLSARADLSAQAIGFGPPMGGAGLRYLAVDHVGNQNCSPEEAEKIAALIGEILDSGATWTDRHGAVKPITSADILIMAPYNAQVLEIQKWVPTARVGTVDKFQGQEAPIAIYSLTSSSHSDAPRGMEFLYSLNRLNVATSRARCVSVIVGSSRVFEPECRTPRQMQLANAFCRYRELATS